MCVLHCKIYSCACLRVVGWRDLLELACGGLFVATFAAGKYEIRWNMLCLTLTVIGALCLLN
jgi:hypothetical protein